MNGRTRTYSAVGALIAAIGCATVATQVQRSGSSTLTILHNNDGESQLLDAGPGLEGFGGVDQFAALAKHLRREHGEATLLLSSGDNILPGPELSAGLSSTSPFFDADALRLLSYDAIAVGNHDFDMGPNVLARLIERTKTPYLAANLDVSAEAKLQEQWDAGRLARSVVVQAGPHRVGIIGLVTPELRSISAPRHAKVSDALEATVRAEVEALESKGVRVIVLLSHLQDLKRDIELTKSLRGVDIVIAGGGDEVLADGNDVLVPGDETRIVGPYPTMALDADGRTVPVVTTPGSYRYLGRITVELDAEGNVTEVAADSGLVRVEKNAGLAPDPSMLETVVAPLRAALDALSKTVVGRSEVPLDGLRESVRGRATNLGDMVADAMLWQARQIAPGHGLAAPAVGLINGGGIRNDSVIPPGAITELDTFDILPFPNFVSVLPGVEVASLRRVLEHAWASTGGGSFLHASGLAVRYGAKGTIQSMSLDDGTPLIVGGQTVEGAPAVGIATISFLARGGGGAPFAGLDFTNLPVTYQQALARYLASASGLAGIASSARYPSGGAQRLRAVD